MSLNQYPIYIPQKMSEPAYHFFREAGQLLLFVFSVTDYAVQTEQTIKYLTNFLDKIDPDKNFNDSPKSDPEISLLDELRNHFENGSDFNKYHKRMLLEIIICKMFDNYLIYLSELLGLVFISRPEIMSPDTDIKLGEVLENSTTRDEFIRYMAEKKVSGLSRENINKLSEFFEKRLKLKLSNQDFEMESINRVSEARNLVVHKRGIIDRHFKKRQPNHSGNLGDLLEFDNLTVVHDLQLLCNSVCSLDNRGTQKFLLKQLITKSDYYESCKLEYVILESGLFFLRLLN